MAKKNAISGKIEIEISGVKYTATVDPWIPYFLCTYNFMSY